jgi:hypothetical protein
LGRAGRRTRRERYIIRHKLACNRGAKSSRVSHPHPVFSVDGKRIFFNVNSVQQAQLHVAEVTS